MSRALFIAKLREGLAGLPQPEIDEAISDYEFHFVEAIATGQSEENIAARLGDPTRLAQEVRSEMEQRRSPERDAKPPTAGSVAVASGGRARKFGPGLLLAILIAIGAAAIYYVAGHGDDRTAPVTATLPAPQAKGGIGAKIVISSGQAVDLGAITQDHIEILLDGGGHVTAHGQVKDLILHIDGSGEANFGTLQADIVHVDVSGTGGAEVSGAQIADITISGSGVVRLKVRPKTLRQSVTGSGQVLLPN
jgi:hypothetical protein